LHWTSEGFALFIMPQEKYWTRSPFSTPDTFLRLLERPLTNIRGKKTEISLFQLAKNKNIKLSAMLEGEALSNIPHLINLASSCFCWGNISMPCTKPQSHRKDWQKVKRRRTTSQKQTELSLTSFYVPPLCRNSNKPSGSPL
jgi:hypothetical protein